MEDIVGAVEPEPEFVGTMVRIRRSLQSAKAVEEEAVVGHDCCDKPVQEDMTTP